MVIIAPDFLPLFFFFFVLKLELDYVFFFLPEDRKSSKETGVGKRETMKQRKM